MITSCQMKAARVILGLDQRELAILSGLSLPTIQRMEASKGVVKGNIDTLVKLVKAFEDEGAKMGKSYKNRLIPKLFSILINGYKFKDLNSSYTPTYKEAIALAKKIFNKTMGVYEVVFRYFFEHKVNL